MKRIIPFFLIIFFASGVFAQVGTLTVTVLSSDTGTGLTAIEYEFTGDDDVYNISAEVSFDNGNSFYPIPGDHLEGALTNVAPGGPYSLIWFGRESFPGRLSNETIIKIGATSATFTCYDHLTFTYRGSEVTYGTVGRGGLCWLDRNLGAYPLPFVPAGDATGNTDTRLYGDLFQWGRGDDGHQVVTWTDSTTGDVTPTTTTLSPTDDPGHGEFIKVTSELYDWRDEQNDALWQGVNGINNPCPPSWRLPTEAELDAERNSWGDANQNSAGAYASTLKWPVSGGRSVISGELGLSGSAVGIWSLSVSGANARSLYFDSDIAHMYNYGRANGLSVRCVRD